MKWYCITHDIQRGPMTLDAMKALVENGTLTPNDDVWTPDFGSEWRQAKNVAELFLQPKAPAEIPFSEDEEEFAPRVFTALRDARRHMVRLLFAPFSIAVWIKFYFFIMMANMRPLENLAGHFTKTFQKVAGNESTLTMPSMLSGLARELVAMWEAFLLAPTGQQIAGVLMVLLSIVVALYICSWGVFLFLHLWHTPRARLSEIFMLNRNGVRDLMKWKFCYALPLLTVLLACAAVLFATVVRPVACDSEVDFRHWKVWAPFLGCGIAGALLTLTNFLTDQLVAPLMYWRQASVRRAFAWVGQCVCAHPFSFVAFALVYAGLILVSSFFVALFLTPAQGEISPFILLLLMACFNPFFVFLRGLSLFYLVQWRPDLIKIAQTEKNAT